MLRTLDIVLIILMTAAATITYSIKHQAEVKQQEVRRIEAEIRLERETIDLLRADWSLLTQPVRLQALVKNYAEQLKLVPTESTGFAQPSELPMLRSELPLPAEDQKILDAVAAGTGVADQMTADGKDKKKKVTARKKKTKSATDEISTGSVKR